METAEVSVRERNHFYSNSSKRIAFAFSQHSIPQWNMLSNSIVQTTSTKQFKVLKHIQQNLLLLLAFYLTTLRYQTHEVNFGYRTLRNLPGFVLKSILSNDSKCIIQIFIHQKNYAKNKNLEFLIELKVRFQKKLTIGLFYLYYSL